MTKAFLNGLREIDCAATWQGISLKLYRMVHIRTLTIIYNANGLMFGSLEWGVLQHMEITLDGLIWDLGVSGFFLAKISMCQKAPQSIF